MTTILDAIGDKNLFAPFFRDRSTYTAWFAFLAALFGLPLATPEQRQIYRQCTKRDAPHPGGHREAWLICGRRSGKSFTLALIAVYLATMRKWKQHLGPGERATVMIIAADRRQARVIMRFVKGLLQVPMLRQQIEAETAERLDLRGSVSIEIHTASFRSTRGYTICAALIDELAFFPTDDASAEPDTEIINAIRPGLMTLHPHSMLLCASSPYSRRGALFDAWKKHHGKSDSAVLVWQAATRTMNPTIPESEIAAALEADPAAAGAEFMAQWRLDVEAFVIREVVDACVDAACYERPPLRNTTYHAFVDPSGGSADSMTLAIAHRGPGDVVVIDALRERRPPFSPEDVVSEFAATLKSYNVASVTGDRYAGEWPREQFRKLRIAYEPAAKPKSDLYRDMLPLLNSGKLALLDNAKLINQLTTLERRTARGGRDSIDHAPGAHDDLANACAGVSAMLGSSFVEDYGLWLGDDDVSGLVQFTHQITVPIIRH